MASGGKLLPGAEVFDDEITEAVRGIEVGLEIGGSAKIKVLLDNQEAVEALVSDRANSSQSEVRKFIELCKAQLDIEIHWVPGHYCIVGDEKSDAMAKAVLASKTREENLTRPECIREAFYEVPTLTALKSHVISGYKYL